MKFFSLLVTLSLLGSHSVAGPAHSVPSVGKKKAKVKKQVKKKKQQKKKTSLSKKKLVKKALSKKKVVGKKVTQRVPHRATVLQDLPHSSIWPVLAQGASLNAGDKKTLFIQDCARLAVDNNIPAKFPPHETNNNTLRIMTYNVHKWLEPFERQDAYEKIMQVINNVQADVMCLQEVVQEPRSTWKDRLNDLGYLYQVYIPLEPARRGWLGNLVASKYPFMQKPQRKVFDIDLNQSAERGFIHVVVNAPHAIPISIYCTHLDVYDNTEARREAEVNELLGFIQADPYANVILAGDFNSVRASDYDYQVNGKKVWDVLVEDDKKRIGFDTPTKALQSVAKAGLQDCFAVAGRPGPKFTVWTGKVVDFIYLRTNTWQLPILGCYEYYNADSDHVPVVMDVGLRVQP